jgi:hypothetical protein
MHGTWDAPQKTPKMPKDSHRATKPEKPTPKGGKVTGKPFPAKGK